MNILKFDLDRKYGKKMFGVIASSTRLSAPSNRGKFLAMQIFFFPKYNFHILQMEVMSSFLSNLLFLIKQRIMHIVSEIHFNPSLKNIK